MAEILLFHHAQGLTEGVEAFAEELRATGPDHLFLDRSLAGYDEDAAALVTRRVLRFLG